jgi:hypothetical protein
MDYATWRRMLWTIDFLGAVGVMLEAEIYGNKPIFAVAFVLGLLSLVMLRILRTE